MPSSWARSARRPTRGSSSARTSSRAGSACTASGSARSSSRSRSRRSLSCRAPFRRAIPEATSMGHGYQAVGWNPQKKIYDRTIALGVALFLAAAVGVGSALNPNATVETLLIRAFGACAFFLLHVILVIGPLARLDRRFLPLLYNRRHLGVTMFFVALAHGAFSLYQFHGRGNVDPLVSVLASNERFGSV